MNYDTKKLVLAIGSIVGMVIIYQLVFFILKRWSRKQKRIIPELLNEHIYFPGLFFVLVVALFFVLLLLEEYVNLKFFRVARHILTISGIITSGILVIKTITVFREITFNQYKVRNPLDYSLRKTKTKFQLIQRILNFLIVFAMFAIILMTFDSIRQIGGTLLASAGVVGLVIGFAAQKSLGTLFAGIQIAISQPIRIDDVVVVEEQFGTIGEITLTYVIVNSWDGRRLVVPISYFLEKPFENWTRVSPEIVAKVKIHADYTLPIEEIRQEFKKWIEASELWDKRRCNFLVTGANDKTIEVRGTATARNSDDAYDLECIIREKLITYIREHHPTCLPTTRISKIESPKT
jgi:small-conductance mechanosensitive channel